MSESYEERFISHVDILKGAVLFRKGQVHAQRVKKRRSKGITKITVTYKKQPLYLWSVYVYDNKGEYEGFKLPGKFPLQHLQGNVYIAHFDVPRGPPVRMLARYSGNGAMLSCPGRPWKVTGMIGKCKDGEENITTGFNISGKGTAREPYSLAQLPEA
ncbi:hypothetical protein [Pseudomonas phage D6]|nr:hypothetical protein [Pseudomonas phage D6]